MDDEKRLSRATEALREIERISSIQDNETLLTQTVWNEARRGLGLRPINFNSEKGSAIRALASGEKKNG